MSIIRTKVALITGGSKGVGLGIARALIMEGICVAITGRTAESLRNAEKELNLIRPDHCLSIVSDVRDLQDQENAVSTTLDKWGQLDIVVANAGIGHFATIENLTPKQWKDVIDINLTGPFNTIKACLPALKRSKGFYITIASLAGTNFFSGGSAYNASKFGLVGFTQAVMLDLRQAGIRVSTIMPGSVATYFNDHIPSLEDSWKIQPEDIGQLVVDLLKMNPRTLPSKIEVRPSIPPKK